MFVPIREFTDVIFTDAVVFFHIFEVFLDEYYLKVRGY